jgi:hypothetical protein
MIAAIYFSPRNQNPWLHKLAYAMSPETISRQARTGASDKAASE